jgi:hypothetical protein
MCAAAKTLPNGTTKGSKRVCVCEHVGVFHEWEAGILKIVLFCSVLLAGTGRSDGAPHSGRGRGGCRVDGGGRDGDTAISDTGVDDSRVSANVRDTERAVGQVVRVGPNGAFLSLCYACVGLNFRTQPLMCSPPIHNACACEVRAAEWGHRHHDAPVITFIFLDCNCALTPC